MKKLKTILQYKYLYKILALTSLLLSLIYTQYYPFTSKYPKETTTIIGIVQDYTITDTKIKITLKAKETILVEYKYNNLVFKKLSYGDKLKVTGELTAPKSNTIFNNFNYKQYLHNKQIYYILIADKIDKVQNNNNYLYTIKNILYNKINKLKSSNYIKTLLLGDNNLSSEIKQSYQINGISHLFSVSGFHINFLSSLLYFYLDRVTYNKKIKYIFIDIFLILYLLLCNTPSLLRCVITNILISINHIFKLNIKKLDLVLLTLTIALIIHPFIIYDIGFIYSYTISYFLIKYQNKYKTNKKIKQTIHITLIAFITSLPITIYNNYEINFLSIILNILIVPLVGTILLPLSIIALIFPIFDNLLYTITHLLEELSLYISNIHIFKLILSKPNIPLIIIYYLVITIILNKKKYLYLLIILLIFHKTLPLYNTNAEVVIFDVGQADSILISTPSRRQNILIDTGTGYEINNIITYLKSIGVSKLDYLIITHGDKDHIGGAISLIDKFKVDKVILNKGEYSDYEKELITKLNIKNIQYTSNIQKIPLTNNNIYLLNNQIYTNENNNSIITFYQYNNYKFLFMGDAEKEVEEDLIKKYNLHNIDILKVGHHGSKTSTNKSFINEINPQYAVISVGENNIYKHPNNSVLDNLKESKVYRTDQKGSIIFKVKKQIKIETSMS